MKKTITCLMLAAITLIFFYGCTSKEYNLAKDSIAEVRYNLYSGTSPTLKTTFMSGKREKDYVINGYSTPLIDFGVLTFNLFNPNVTNTNNATFVLTAGTHRYDGNLEINPFDGTYVADIGVIVDIDDSLTAKITIGSYTEEIALNKLNKDWALNHDEALELACKELKSELKDFMDTTFLGEVYIKIIYDDKIQKDSYYWYINFAGRGGVTHSIIINPYTSEILAKK